MEGDAIYFGRRASEEREAATKAVNPQARDAHLTMAERYADLARALEDREPQITLSIAN